MRIKTIEIEEWSDFLKLEPEFGMHIYRGHADASWELETSLLRTVKKNHILYDYNLADVLYSERASLRTFRSRAHFYLDDLPSEEDAISWLTLMQHHGTPTRLLDFTRSLYVAIYFALIDTTTDACVWAIQDHWLRDTGSSISVRNGHKRKNDSRYGQLDSMYRMGNQVINKNSFEDEDDHDEKGVLMIEPERQIPRLSMQQGIFLMPMTFDTSFKENLASLQAYEYPTVQKLVIPYKLREHALMHLKSMNVTAETLFPGIDGFAKSLVHLDML